jgi:hypothetical protein
MVRRCSDGDAVIERWERRTFFENVRVRSTVVAPKLRHQVK